MNTFHGATYLHSDVVAHVVPAVDKEREEGELHLLNAEGHLAPHNDQREESKGDGQEPVYPRLEPQLPIPF